MMGLIRIRRFPLFRFLLAIFIASMWLRSHSHSDVLSIFLHHGRATGVVSDSGRTVAFFTNITLGERRAYTYDLWRMTHDEFAEARMLLYETPPRPAKLVGTLLGASGPDAFGLPGAKYQFIAIPFWMLAALAGVPLAVGLRTFWHRRKWGTKGVCGGCGYDLRASSGRCPECGEGIAEGKLKRTVARALSS